MKAIRIITLFMASAAVAAITSCAKEEASAPEQEQISIIKADIVQPTDESATKTSLGEGTGNPILYPVLWKNLDAIAVSGKSATEYATYTTNDNTQSGTFTLSSGTAPKGEVYAYYPAGNVTGVSSATYTVTIPAEQNYVESSFGNGAFPMYASATTLEGGLTFQPLMSVLKLQLASSDLKSNSKVVKRIIVTSDTENLSGTAQINMGTGAITWTEEGAKKVELICGSGVTLGSTAKTFHVVVPASESKNYYAAIVTDDSQTVYLGMVKNLKGKTFTVGKIKKMASVEVTTSTAEKSIYVEGSYMGDGIAITTGSPSVTTVWAPVNCGYEPATAISKGYPYGKLYQWGRKDGQGYDSNDATYPSGDNLVNSQVSDLTTLGSDKFYYGSKNWYNGESPSADVLWGATKTDYDPCPSDWRVPTYAELYALLGSHTSGSLQTGTHGSTSSLSGKWFDGSTTSEPTSGVFLPAAGARGYLSGSADLRGENGHYWSSSVDGNSAKFLIFRDKMANMNNGYRAVGQPVRCVQD